MTDIRELRLAIEAKLKDRRRLLTENATIRRESAARENFLLGALKSPLVNMAMEDCADAIVNEILSRAIEASRAIAEQTFERGDYEIGISIPSLHIRHRLSKESVNLYSGEKIPERLVKRVNFESPRRNEAW